MGCREIEPYLSAWLDGQLAQAEAEPLRRHLARCRGCQQQLQAVERAAKRLKALGSLPADPAPAGLLARVERIPSWLIRLGLLRRAAPAMAGVAGIAAACVWWLSWSAPVPVVLTAGGLRQEQVLATGTTLRAQAGESLELELERGRGSVSLQGPGTLVVRRAAAGRAQPMRQLFFELPQGTATIRIAPLAGAHDVRVKTPQAELRLLGTWIRVTADSSVTQVGVLEGAVALTSLADGRRAMLAAGDSARVQPGVLTVGQIPLEEWLAEKGLLGVSHAEPAAREPSDKAQSASPDPLWHEAR